MTVTDLIHYLEKLPKDTVIGVVYQAYSDLSILEESDLFFTDKAFMDSHKGVVATSPDRRYVLRHGKIMEYDEHTWDKNETPVFVPVLMLPGN
jgi:hypothetical protein